MFEVEKILRDLAVFALVSLFYLAVLVAVAAFRARSAGKKAGRPADFRAELRRLLSNRNFARIFAAVYLFTAMYAVKNVAFRIILVFIYAALIVGLVRDDLAGRGK